MQTEYFVLNQTRTNQNKRSRKGLLLAGSLVVVGTVAALCLLGNRQQSETLGLFAEGGNLETEQAFMQFLAQYGKTYASKTHINTRYQNFVNNFKAIREHNSQGHDYEMGINQFSDLTIEEFTDLYHKDGLAMPTEEARKPLRHPSLQAAKKSHDKPASLPDKVDWREAGKVTTPQD